MIKRSGQKMFILALILLSAEGVAQSDRSIRVNLTPSSVKWQAPGRENFAPRVEWDNAHGRIWALGASTINVYDARKRTLLKRVELPEWSFLDYPLFCPPGIVVDFSGNAIVSSNNRPELWVIDGRSLIGKRVDLMFDSDEKTEIGFSALFVVGPRTLIGVSAAIGALWHIDLETHRAKSIKMQGTMPDACAIGFRDPMNANPRKRVVLCAVTRRQSYQIEVNNLKDAIILNESCS